MRLFGYLLIVLVFGGAAFVGHQFYLRFDEQRLAVIEAQRVVNTLREENVAKFAEMQAALAESNRRVSETEAALAETRSRLEDALKDKETLQVAMIGRIEELLRLARETRLLTGRAASASSSAAASPEHEGVVEPGQDGKALPAPKLRLPKGITREQERENLERRGTP